MVDILKVAKYQKVFHFGSNLQKLVPNYSPKQIEDYDDNELQFLEIGVKVKIFLRFNYL